jgi:nucleoid-associated protein YgaU
MHCPICKAEVPSTQTTCPRCGEDLSAVLLVEHLSVVHYNDGLHLASAGRVDEAVERLTASLSFDPGCVDALVVLGKLSAQRGRFDDAIGYWRRALALDAENTAALEGIRLATELRTQAQTRAQRAARAARARAIATPVVATTVALALAGGLWFLRPAQAPAATPPVPPPASVATAVPLLTTPPLVPAIQSALQSDPTLTGRELNVGQSGDVAYLSGSVASPDELARAAILVRGVAGVSAVDTTDVRVVPPALADQVTRALHDEPTLAAATLDVQQVGPGVRLRGTVPTDALRRRAEALARAVPGVYLVDSSEVEVVAAPAEYVVAPGDTLVSIAQRVYGEASRWPSLYDANRDRIARPDLILPGTRLIVPPLYQQ